MRCCSCMKEYPGEYEVCPHCGYIRDSQGEGMYYLPQGVLLSNRYEIGIQINAGGFGIIYKAWDRIFNKMVAIKEYYPGGIAARTPGTREVLIYSNKREEEYKKGKERFLNEARTVAKFNTHPNIANVYDFFEDNNTAYMVMDYMEGMSYKEFIHEHNGIVDIKTAIQVSLAVLDALKEVHKSKIIHRDINPSNIFICSNGVVKLIDFGAARIEQTDMTTILTPHFAAPEQYQSNSVQGPYTDIYAVGATLYYAVTGVKPEESIDRVLKDELPEPSQLNPDIPPYLNNAIMRAMAVREELRFQNAGQFQNAIKNEGIVLNVEEVIKKRKKQRLAGVCGAFVTLALVVGICFMVINQRKEKAVLADAQLEVWIPAKDGEALSDVQDEFDKMIVQFKNDYPQVGVHVTAISSSNYKERIDQAAKEDSLPDLFDSTGLDPLYYEKLESLEDTYDLVDPKQYYFLDDYGSYFKSMKQMPLCFQIPVLYATAVNSELEIPAVFNSFEALKTGDDYSYSVNSADFQIFGDMAGEDCITVFKNEAQTAERDYLTDGFGMFADQTVSYYLSDTSDYMDMMNKIPGQFQVVLCDKGGLKGRFDRMFSVAAYKPEQSKKAAKRLIYYLLSENAQDVLCLQNAAGLPVNKLISKEFANLNSQDFSDIEAYIQDITMQGEEQNISYANYMKKWEN